MVIEMRGPYGEPGTAHYLIFETAGGFCGIAWNNVGITRFQLPTKSAAATERTLLRRMPGAEHGAPTPEVIEAVAAVKRYFEGEQTDFSGFRLDLGEQHPFFEQIYAAARRIGWGQITTYGTLAKELGAGPEAARDRPGSVTGSISWMPMPRLATASLRSP
jgi:methylated-DNA-[protein]-cysteine S-methyltransferase